MMHLLTSTPSYLWKSPAEWLRADATHVNCVIQEIVTLTGSTEIEQAKFVREMIYYRLIVYIFAHLTLFTSVFTVEIFHRDGINRLFSNFKVTLEHWQSWDSMTIVENYLKTRHYLCNRFRLDLQSYLSCHDESVLGALLALGDTGLTSNTRKCSVGGSGTGSIESPSGTHKCRHVNALVKLSRASRCYPECLVLQGVEIGDDAVAGDSFGDVFRGRFKGQEITVKVLFIKNRIWTAYLR